MSIQVFPQFNEPALGDMIRSRHRLGTVAAEVFSGSRVQDRFVRELCARRVLNTKETLESFEFHRAVRRRVRRPVVVDLCCGHGLTGVLFALLETTVERVILVDHRRPESVSTVIQAAVAIAPWVKEKITYLEQPLDDIAELIPTKSAIVGVHACGRQTDRVIDIGLNIGGPIAVMPCCYRTARKTGGPKGIKTCFGTELAVDIDRSYRIDGGGMQVDWTEIAPEITPMNRVLIGWFPHP